MKTQKELVEYYTKQADKVIQSCGVNSDASNGAIFKLQAINAGIAENDIFKYAKDKMDELHKLELDNCGNH